MPKYRGFAPLVNSLVNGEKIIGVTALFASEEYDNGDIIMQSSVDITYPIYKTIYQGCKATIFGQKRIMKNN